MLFSLVGLVKEMRHVAFHEFAPQIDAFIAEQFHDRIIFVAKHGPLGFFLRYTGGENDLCLILGRAVQHDVGRDLQRFRHFHGGDQFRKNVVKLDRLRNGSAPINNRYLQKRKRGQARTHPLSRHTLF